MKLNNSHSDQDLVSSLKEDNHGAFEKLFLRYAQKLFAFSLSYLKKEEDAQEVVQEVFLKIWDNRSSLKTDTSFQSYLFTIAYNSIKKTFNRKLQSDQFKHELINELEQNQDSLDFENNYQLVIDKLEMFIDEMPEKRKLIFISRKKENISVKEIAANMDISVKTVENQITEAMKYIKRRFEDELPGGLLFFTLFIEK